MHVIKSVGGFARKVKPSGKFYTLNTQGWEPVSVDGPYILQEALRNGKIVAVKDGQKLCMEVADLVNSTHGVCLTKKEASKLFRERRHRWEKDQEKKRLEADTYNEENRMSFL